MPRVTSDSQMKSSELFRKRINELIANQDCSIYEFAERANVGKGVITRAAIHGIIPSVRLLIKIADALNISLEYMIGLTDTMAFDLSQNQSAFHQRIQELCQEKGVKYSQIGTQMPFSTNLFYDWQREKTLPSLEYLIAIAKYFKVTIDYLLGRTDDRN